MANKLAEIIRLGILSYAQSAGVVAYAGLQWLLLLKFSDVGGYKAAGDFALAQAFAGPIFSFCSFSLRPLWVSGVVERLKFIDVLWLRCISTVLAACLTATIGLIANLNVISEVAYIVLLLKIQEAYSDIIYARLDKQRNSLLAGKLLFAKSLLLGAILLTSILMNFSLQFTTNILFMVVAVSLIAETYFAHHVDGFRFSFPDKLYSQLSEAFPFIFWASCSSLVIALVGFLPRYGLEAFIGREAVGYYSVITLPATLVLLITTGFSQSSLRIIALSLKSGDTKYFLRQLFPGLIKVSLISVIILCGLLFASKILSNYNFDKHRLVYDMSIALLLSIPIFIVQYLSYAALAAAKLQIVFIFNVASLLLQTLILKSATTYYGVLGAISTQAIGSVIQGCGFVVAILIFLRARKSGKCIRFMPVTKLESRNRQRKEKIIL
jgi:O-antigen/teichoic acid export membrane protein